MSARFREQFPDVVFEPVQSPQDHPLVQYQGFRPDEVTVLPRGHVKASGYQAFPLDVVREKDRAVPMRDDVKIYVDVYRAKDAPKVPAVLAWSPYGKGGGDNAVHTYDSMGPYRMGIPYGKLSGYESFEGPNPADFCRRGYAVVHADPRGCGHSEGDMYFWGPQEALDIYDTISWIAEQPWCNGSVVMMGNSWLAIAQINFASRHRHPALKAIAPWEAMNDAYKQIIARGGRPSPPGLGDAIVYALFGMNLAENPNKTLSHRPLYDDYWDTKRIDTSKIDIPMYLLGSYSTRLHSAGSFKTFANGKKGKTWLRVHATQEWTDLYNPESMDDLQKFFDFYTKDAKNGWDKTPPLRLSLIGFNGSPANTIIQRPEPDDSYPLARTKMRALFLDAQNMTMGIEKPSAVSTTSFEGHSFTDKATFEFKFSTYTELSGWPWLRVFMHCDSATDMDVEVIIRKVSMFGKRLEHMNYYIPFRPCDVPDLNVPKFVGPSGVLRASHRVSILDKKDPGDYPEYSHRKAVAVEPIGTIVELQIPIWPIGMVFEEGEGVHLDIAGHELQYPEGDPPGPKPIEPVDSNKGKFFVHTGGEYASALMLPFIAGGDF